MLHFGRKYDMRGLRREAVHCLMLEFPSTLRQWSNQLFGNVIDGINSESMEKPTISLFEILYLAHENSITSILPALYLRICLTHNAVSQVVLFGSHIYLDSCILIVRKKSSRAFNMLQKIRVSVMTDCWLTVYWVANTCTDRSPPWIFPGYMTIMHCQALTVRVVARRKDPCWWPKYGITTFSFLSSLPCIHGRMRSPL